MAAAVRVPERIRSRTPRGPVVPRSISLGLLGGFELRVDGYPVLLPKTAKRLLAFLAFSHRPLARTHVSQSLWLEATERHADGNLRSALWKVGKSAPAIDASGGQLALSPWVTVDYRQSVALAHRLVHDPDSLEEQELDVEAFGEDVLPDWYEEWVIAERERYRQLRLHALEDLCKKLVARRRYGPAVQAALAAVTGEPLRESANLALIRVYLAEGNAVEATRHYQSFRRLLSDELGVAPTSQMKRLIDEVKAQ